MRLNFSLLLTTAFLFAQQPSEYVTYFGYSSNETAVAISSDPSGNTYFAGRWEGALNAPGPDPSNGSFLVKISSNQVHVYTALLPRTTIAALHADSNGFLYAAGNVPRGAQSPAYVVKLDFMGERVFETELSRNTIASFFSVTAMQDGSLVACGTAVPESILREYGSAIRHDPSLPLSQQAAFCAKFHATTGEFESGVFPWPTPAPIVTALATTSEGRILAAGAAAPIPLERPRSLFRLTPNADRWEPVPGAPDESISRLQFINSKMYLSAANGLLVSSDQGAAFQRINTVAPLVPDVVVQPLNPRYACGLIGNAPYCSSDGGTSFRIVISRFPTGGGAIIRSLYPDPHSEGLFHFVGSFVFSVPDWLGRQIPYYPLSHSLAIQQTQRGLLYWTLDVTALYLQMPGQHSRSVLQGVAAVTAPPGEGSVYALRTDGHPSRIARSDDSGNTWIDLAPDFQPPITSASSLVIHPGNPSHLFLLSSGGLYCSTDKGASWTDCNDGLSNLAVTSLAVDSSGNIWAGAALQPRSFLTRINFYGEPSVEMFTTLDGSGGAAVRSIAETASGHILLAGVTDSTDIDGRTGHTLVAPPSPRRQSFVSSFHPDGTLEWTRVIGRSGTLLSVDSAGRLHLAGGTEPAFALNSDASAVLSSTATTWPVTAMHIGRDNRIRLLGSTHDSAVPTTPGSLQPEKAGLRDLVLLIREIE